MGLSFQEPTMIQFRANFIEPPVPLQVIFHGRRIVAQIIKNASGKLELCIQTLQGGDLD
jgi:hypothetical protein